MRLYFVRPHFPSSKKCSDWFSKVLPAIIEAFRPCAGYIVTLYFIEMNANVAELQVRGILSQILAITRTRHTIGHSRMKRLIPQDFPGASKLSLLDISISRSISYFFPYNNASNIAAITTKLQQDQLTLHHRNNNIAATTTLQQHRGQQL